MTSTGNSGWTRERYYLFMGLLFFVGLSWIVGTRVPSAERQKPTTAAPRPGFLAPDFELPTLDGRMVKLSDYRGHHVVLNFWATWCPPCKAEMPAIVKEYNRYKGEGLVVLAIDQAESPEKVRAFVEAHGMTFPVLLDEKMRVADVYRIRSLPTTYFITPDGTIIDKVEGMMNEAMVRSRFQHLMESR
ncbi:MAG: redoxin domain-containing protein [Chloroflexi bacterium]|nr:redoxin domain-containing protein [Chloroflexota bacterium]